MARTHDLLVKNDWAGAEVKDVVRSEIRAFVEDGHADRVTYPARR